MGILGFLFGGLIVIILRSLQGLTPLWDTGAGIVLGVLMAAAFFVWGVGGFDPRMSVHGEAADEVDEEAEATPAGLLRGSIWQIATLLLLLLLAVAAFALLPGGLALTITADPLASTAQVGMFEMELPFGGPVVQVSQLVVFIVVIIIMFLSLGVAAAVISAILYALNRGIREAQTGGTAALAVAGGPSEAALQTAGEGGAARVAAGGGRSTLGTIIEIVKFVVLALILYLLFYYVLIGLVLPGSPLLMPLSLINAVIFALLILRPAVVLRTLGRVSGWLVRVLQALPRVLFQK
jgi:hypothetical protein